MKKLLAILLSCAMMTASLVSCSKDDDDDDSSSRKTTTKNKTTTSATKDNDDNDDDDDDNSGGNAKSKIKTANSVASSIQKSFDASLTDADSRGIRLKGSGWVHFEYGEIIDNDELSDIVLDDVKEYFDKFDKYRGGAYIKNASCVAVYVVSDNGYLGTYPGGYVEADDFSKNGAFKENPGWKKGRCSEIEERMCGKHGFDAVDNVTSDDLVLEPQKKPEPTTEAPDPSPDYFVELDGGMLLFDTSMLGKSYDYINSFFGDQLDRPVDFPYWGNSLSCLDVTIDGVPVALIFDKNDNLVILNYDIPGSEVPARLLTNATNLYGAPDMSKMYSNFSWEMSEFNYYIMLERYEDGTVYLRQSYSRADVNLYEQPIR